MKIHSPMGTCSRGKLQPFRWTTPIGTLACVHSGFTWCAQAEKQVPFIDGMVEIVGQCWKKVQQHSLPLAATCLAGAGFLIQKHLQVPHFDPVGKTVQSTTALPQERIPKRFPWSYSPRIGRRERHRSFNFMEFHGFSAQGSRCLNGPLELRVLGD